MGLSWGLLGSPWALLASLWGCLGTLLGLSWASLGLSWGSLGLSQAKKRPKSKLKASIWDVQLPFLFVSSPPFDVSRFFGNSFGERPPVRRTAFSIRPLPGFSLGAVLRFFCPTRLSQSVQVCQISTEFSPRTPAHSAGPSEPCWSRDIVEPQVDVKMGRRWRRSLFSRCYCHWQNLSFTKAKLGFRA